MPRIDVESLRDLAAQLKRDALDCENRMYAATQERDDEMASLYEQAYYAYKSAADEALGFVEDLETIEERLTSIAAEKSLRKAHAAVGGRR